MQRKFTIDPRAFQLNLDNPNFLIKKILATLNVVTFVTDIPNDQPPPAELMAALSATTQTNEACTGKPFGRIGHDRPDHMLFHREEQDNLVHHFHREACELIEPEHLYDTLRQLVELQKDPQFLRNLAEVYQREFPKCTKDWALTGKNLLPTYAPDVANSTYDPLFRSNEKIIRESQLNYENFKLEFNSANKQAYIRNLALSGGFSFVMAVGFAGIGELLKIQGYSSKQVQNVLEMFFLVFALATGSYSGLMCMMLVKGMMARLDRDLEGLPMLGRMAIMFGLYGAVSKATLSEFDIVNFTVNTAAALGGELAVKAAVYIGSNAPAPQQHVQFFQAPAPTVSQEHRARQPSEVKRKQMQHNTNKDEAPKEWFKPGFLNRK